MAKVKMSDIKSGSENVKNLFKRSMSTRYSNWLKNIKFSSDELVEILDICENIEHHKDSREFYNLLLLSQDTTFSHEVFEKYMNVIFENDTLMHLLARSDGLTEQDKEKWINSSILSSFYWFIPNFYQNGESKKYGIDITQYPYNLTLASAMVRYRKRFNKNCVFAEGFSDYMKTILDTLTEDQLYEWYTDVVRQTYEESAVNFLSSYPKTTERMLSDYYNNRHKNNKLAIHPNFPKDIKNKIFLETGDEKYLPTEVKDIFIF